MSHGKVGYKEWELSWSVCVCERVFDLLRQANNCLSRVAEGGATQEMQLKSPSRLRGKIWVNSETGMLKQAGSRTRGTVGYQQRLLLWQIGYY